MLDITPMLDGWNYDPDEITVRLVEGRDGKPKIQMRLDLGLLQMNYDGRPDGKRPNEFESIFHYYQNQLETHRRQFGSDKGFFLDPDDCEAISSEALQYYYRYLSLFHLQEYTAVIRDTQRNLNVFEFVKKYSETEEDRKALEQYRPYVIMMYTRAAAHLALEKNEPAEAALRVKEGIDRIKRFFIETNRPKMVRRSRELIFLKELLKELPHLETDPVRELRQKMREAVDREDYETAAEIRDQIRRLSGKTSG
ncbi:MAG: UvrB/UvrC motif-containing protein [Candidatus Hinthialibacter antarcticus]|nr:UvrB/UvrC motif-containing protein [Candidatus Hinthialibacter antarcticus]